MCRKERDEQREASEWAEFMEEVARNHRPHAGHFSWETDRAIAEQGVVKELEHALALDGKLFFRDVSHRGEGNDPPDCEAVGVQRQRIGIEITELVDSKSAAAARHGNPYEWKDWKGALIPELERILTKKDAPSNVKGGPYDQYVLLVFSDEPLLGKHYIETQLLKHAFPATDLVTRAFLLLSYDPFIRSYPCIEFNILDS